MLKRLFQYSIKLEDTQEIFHFEMLLLCCNSIVQVVLQHNFQNKEGKL